MKCPGQDKQFWRIEDIFDITCPSCGQKVEFFKDDIRRKCRQCGIQVTNPKFDQGCAEWCPYAKECLGIINNKKPNK